MNYMRHFYERKGCINYSQDTSWKCVLEHRGQYEADEIAYDTFLYVWKVSEMLEECHDKGIIARQCSSKWVAKKTSLSFFKVAEAYERYRLDKVCSLSTVRGERSEIHHFLACLQEIGCRDLLQIRRQDVTAYIISVSSERASGMSSCLTRLRACFRYLIENGIIHEAMLSTLQLKTSIHKKVHSGFTMEESDLIIQAVDRDTPVGKRDYAMLLLARHTGLRAVDVIHLKLQDIDWHKNEISVIQHKIRRPLILPLENIVGNAIEDYILNARSKSDSNHVYHYDSLKSHLSEIETALKEAMTPFSLHIEQLTSIYGIITTASFAIIAEIGTDQNRRAQHMCLGWLCSDIMKVPENAKAPLSPKAVLI